MTRRIRGTALALVAFTALALAPAAHASEEDTFVCVVSAAIAFAPPIPPVPAALLAPGAHAVGPPNPVTCVHDDMDATTGLGDATQDTGVYAGTIVGAGAYLSIDCASFLLSGGPASITIALPGDTESPVTMTHNASFIHGDGVIEGMAVDLTGSTGPAAGVLNFTPAPVPPGPCVPPTPLAGGTLTGVLVVSLV